MQGSLSSLFLGTKWSWIRGDCDTDNSSQRSHLVANSLLDHRWLTKCWGYLVCGFSLLDVTWLPGAPQQRPSSCVHQTSWCHEVLPHISLAAQGFLARAGKGYCSWPKTKHDVFLEWETLFSKLQTSTCICILLIADTALGHRGELIEYSLIN